MKLIFLDTETTGISETDRLIQVAYKVRAPFSLDFSEPEMEYFHPPVPISFEAMATHHITPAMVEKSASFESSNMKNNLLCLVNETILVAHNAPFDLEMLRREGVVFPNFIDTLQVAKHLIDAPSHKLQYLRYALDLNVAGEAHDARGDVNVLVALFDYLYERVKSQLKTDDRNAIIDRLTTLSTLPALLKSLPFGKYVNKPLEEILRNDRQYLEWLRNSESLKPESERNRDLFLTLQTLLK